jgi:hypothetical protein
MKNDLLCFIISIKVWNIRVEGKNSGYYSFKYRMKINNKKEKHGECDGSWDSQTSSNFRRVLKNGYAFRLVLEKEF